MRFFREHYEKIWIVYTITVVILWFQPLPIPFLYPSLLVLYALLSIAWFQLSGFSLGYSKSKFLCDSCKYNYGEICSKAERPNATECDDYKKR